MSKIISYASPALVAKIRSATLNVEKNADGSGFTATTPVMPELKVVKPSESGAILALKDILQAEINSGAKNVQHSML